MTVNLDYFKPNGKWYSEGHFDTPAFKEVEGTDRARPLYEIWRDVQKMARERKLPGLVQGHDAFIVSIDVPEHPHNHPVLLLPPQYGEDITSI